MRKGIVIVFAALLAAVVLSGGTPTVADPNGPNSGVGRTLATS